jgi:Holliday junction resolvase RusA-like endonuclease
VIAFRIPCIPPTATHHHKKIVRVRGFYKLADRPELRNARDMIDGLLVPYRPPVPMRGAIALKLVFTWPWPSGTPKQVRRLGRVPRMTKPDCSNVAKMIEDRLAALLFFTNDTQVARLVVEKYNGDDPGIGIALRLFIGPLYAQRR